MSKIKSNCTYEDTLSIYSKLPASDKRWFHNRFVDSPRIRFRWIEYYNGDKAGFVELYDLEKNGNLNIAIAILPAYRGKGLLHKLVAKAEEYTNSTKSYNRLVWCALFGNTRSMEAAKHMGFTFFKKDTQDMIYIKDMKINDIKKKVLSIVGNYPICVISDKLSFAIYKKSDSAIDNIVKKLKVSDISISDSITYNDKLEKVRDSISKVKEYLISAGISSFFIISDRCSITNSKQNSVIVNKARNIQIEWEKKNGYDPDEDWSEKDTQDMITEEESINESVLGMELYHASVESYHGKLTPIAPCFGTKLYDPHWAIYFWNDKEKARWYATTQILRDYVNKNYKTDPKLKGYTSWDNLTFDYDNNRTILDEKMYSYFKKKLIGKTAYIYTVKVPPHKLHNVRIGHNRFFNEYTYKEPIPIFHKEVVVMTENMFDQYHKVDSVKNIVKFNNTKKFNRGIESVIFLSPEEFRNRRKKFRNLKYVNKIEDGKGDLNDIIQNKNELPMIKSDKDIYCNFSKFPKENNILFVTGMSGSGKFTLTKKLAKKYNAIQISLDCLHYFPCRIIHDPNRSLEDLSRKDPYKEDRRSFEYIMKFLKSNNGKKLLNIYKKCKTNAEVSDKKVLDKLFEYLFEFIEKSNIKDPIIIEGTQLIEVPDKYLDYPFVFKSVSFCETMYRRFKREDLNRFVAFIPQYNKWRKDQNVLRDKVISISNDIRYSNNEEPI